MNISDLEAFIHFSESLNFTKSAEALLISQPALHQKIRKLSESLGVELYVKEKRHLVLTSEGEELARFGRETVAQYSVFQQRLKRGTVHETVSLIAGTGAFRYLLGPAIQEFQQIQNASLRLLTGDRDATLEALRTGKAQLGVTVLRERPTDLRGSILMSVPAKLVVPRGHRLARRRQVRLADLAEESLIVPPSPSPLRETLEVQLYQQGVRWKVGVEAGGWDLMMHFVTLGLGLTVVNGCCDVPKTCQAIPMPELPGSDYYLLRPRLSLKQEASHQLAGILQRTVRSGGSHQGEP